ncbi:MAG TPA: hypothetical protein VFL27_11365 [Candidatus Dormibacteraeota bacterium]|nr:hypothetical protein [Candidatus Dormibacteraeota bacterium]
MTNRDPDGAIMAPGQMAGGTTHTDQDELEAAGLYSPPLRRTPVRQTPAWAAMLQSHERRWWATALVATLVVGATATGLLYADDYNKQATIRSLQTANESLTGRNLILNDQLKTTQTNLTATLGELATTRAQLDHPTLVTWSKAQTIPDNTTYLASGIPDSFTLHLQLASSGPMDVSIVTIEAFAAGVDCVHNGVAVTDYCMHRQQGIEISWLGKTSINYDFHKAEGCADYIVVVTAPAAVTITPNVSITYSPATGPTGACVH